MKVLFLLPYCPVPPDSGNKNLIDSLLSFIDKSPVSYDVALMIEGEGLSAEKAETAMRRRFPKVGSVTVFKKPRGWVRIARRVQNMLSGWHPALGNYWNADLYQWLAQACETGRYDIVHFDMIHMAQYVSAVRDVPTLLIASDAYSMAATRASQQARRLSYRLKNKLESLLLSNVERNLYRNFAAVCTVSEQDTRYLAELTGLASLRTVGIAVSDEYTTRSISHLQKLPADNGAKILVTGSLAHELVAHDAAVFLDEQLPVIRQQFPELDVVVLGRGATAELRESLSRATRVEHVDFVEDYAGFLERDWIYVYPQRCGSGLQTKLQQAMALGLPVVGYEVSFGGLAAASSGRQAYICTEADELVEAVCQLAGSAEARQEMGTNAAKFVRETFSVERVGQQMLGIYEDVIARTRSQ